MELYPAIDLRGGGAVRLVQGDFAREQAYGDPVALAESFVAGGARWLHVVDLDAARTGVPANRAVLAEICAAVPVPVQTGGGVRSLAEIEARLADGAQRVVLGTAALEDPAVARAAAAAFPGQVALGLDYRRLADGRLEAAVRGWVAASGWMVGAVLAELADAGLAATVVTAIERDGTLAGPDLDGLAKVLATTELAVVASGGVGTLEDLGALAALVDGPSGRRLAGVVVGRALLDGAMSVEEAKAACTPSG